MMKPFESNLKATISAALFVSAIALPVDAMTNDVQLDFRDGSGAVIGSLVSYLDGVYKVETPLGNLRVSARLVNCQGVPCPSRTQVLLDRQAARETLFHETSVSENPDTTVILLCALAGAASDPFAHCHSN